MILFIANSGESLPIALRLQKEGEQVAVYIHQERYQRNYDGMIPKIQMNALRAAIRRSDMVIFDMNKPVENKRDRALQKLFKVKGDYLYGPVADSIRSTGIPVFGCAEATETIELDRNAGTSLAKRIGLNIPKTYDFGSLAEGTRFLKNQHKKLWCFKPHENMDLDLTYVEKEPGELLEKFKNQYPKRLPEKIDYLLQEKVEGVEISTEGFWTGKKWVLLNHTMEDKCFMNHDLGPRIGSSTNVVWLKSKKGINTSIFQNLTPWIVKSGYTGPIDINCIISGKNHEPYFLEFTPRMGYDAIYCLLTFFKSVSEWLEYAAGVSGTAPQLRGGFGAAVRVSLPPFPYTDEPALLKKQAEGVSVSGDLKNFWLEDVHKNGNDFECSGADGIIGVATGHGSSVKSATERAYEQIEKAKIGGYIQYRTDAGERAIRDRKRIRDWGLEMD